MYTKQRIVFLFILWMGILSGCVEGDLHVTINKDGSGIYQWKVLSNAYAKNYLQQVATLYTNKGYEAKLIKERGKVGFVATKPVTNIAEHPLNKEVMVTASALSSKAVLAPTQNPIKELTIKSGFFHTSLRYQTAVNMNKAIQNLAGPYSPYINQFLDRLRMRFLLTLPIAPTETNANVKSKDGKTLLWNLKLGQTNPIMLGITVPTPIILIVAIANDLTNYVPNFWTILVGWIALLFCGILLIILIIRWFLRRKRAAVG